MEWGGTQAAHKGAVPLLHVAVVAYLREVQFRHMCECCFQFPFSQTPFSPWSLDWSPLPGHDLLHSWVLPASLPLHHWTGWAWGLPHQG